LYERRLQQIAEFLLSAIPTRMYPNGTNDGGRDGALARLTDFCGGLHQYWNRDTLASCAPVELWQQL